MTDDKCGIRVCNEMASTVIDMMLFDTNEHITVQYCDKHKTEILMNKSRNYTILGVKDYILGFECCDSPTCNNGEGCGC